jgi:hypothetical protein
MQSFADGAGATIVKIPSPFPPQLPGDGEGGRANGKNLKIF